MAQFVYPAASTCASPAPQKVPARWPRTTGTSHRRTDRLPHDQPLAPDRRGPAARGISTGVAASSPVIDVEDIYDQFNHGHLASAGDPQADASRPIRSGRSRRPRYALLVGDASFDIRHTAHRPPRKLAKWADSELLSPGTFGDIPEHAVRGHASRPQHRNLIPTWQFASYDGQSASDNHFVSVGKDPLHPVIAVGRFPVVEPAEVKAIVDKTINYPSTPQPRRLAPRCACSSPTKASTSSRPPIKIADELAAKAAFSATRSTPAPTRRTTSRIKVVDQARPQRRPPARAFHRPRRPLHLAHGSARSAQEP